jgi:hypothetical protein
MARSPVRAGNHGRAAASLGAAFLFLMPLAFAGATASAAAPPTPDGAPFAPAPQVVINAASFAGTKYLIVTAGAYASTMQSIADWKTQKGLPARVALIEDIKASYAGRDDAEKLHNFLQDVYWNATNKGLQYVLLGGGAGVIPVRYLFTNGAVAIKGGYTHDFVFSDVYYAGLGSDWDGNLNGIYGEYGEEDWDADVYVGRLPFNTLSDAGFARDNLLSYEKAPFVGSWMSSAAAFASVMTPPNDLTNYDSTKDNALMAIQLTQPYLPSTMSLELLADYYELGGGNYSTAQDRLSNASMVGSINAGKSVVISVTHGWVPSGHGIPQYTGFDGVANVYSNGLDYTDASGFTNFGQLSFGYFSSCLVGNYSNVALPNLGRFVVQDNHGFIAEVVPTDGTLRGENDANAPGLSVGNWWQSEDFWKNFFTGAQPFRPGPALYQGIRDYTAHLKDVGQDGPDGGYRTQKAVYNLLGDPEVPIWTQVASTFNASMPSVLYTAEQHFRATLRDALGRPAAGASVAVAGDGVYAVGTTDAQGRIDMVVAPTSVGSLRATVTLHNFIPFEITIPVQTAPPDLAIEPQNVTLPSPVLRTGDPAAVDFTVRNVGQQGAGATDARAYVTPPGGLPQLVAPSIPMPGLAPGEQWTGSFTWAPAEDGLHGLRIVVDPSNAVAEFDELNNEVTVQVEASGVDLSLDPLSVSLNPPGQVAPGGVIAVTGLVGHLGLVPRSYLIGYQLRREGGSVVVEGNTAASATQSAFSFNVLAPEAGNFSLVITADAAREIVEFNESNNEAVFAVRAGQGPALFSLPSVFVDEDAPPTAAISDLRGFVSDPDTPFDQLTFTATAAPSDLAVWVDGVRLMAYPRPHWSGAGFVRLTVSDGRETSSTTTAFTVFGRPEAPSVETPPAQVAVVGVPFVYALSATDPGGGNLTFSSSNSGAGPFPTLPIDAQGVIAFVPSAAVVGAWQFAITVRNDAQMAASVPFMISVLPADNAPRLVDLGELVVTRGSPATFTLLAIDPDGDPVAFSISSSRASLSGDGRLSFTAEQVAALQDGTTTIPVTVSDGLQQSQGNVTVVVREATSARCKCDSTDFAAQATMLAAVAAAVAGIVFTVRRRRRPQ